MGAKIFQKSRSRLKNESARSVTRSVLHTDDPQILGVAVHNLVAIATWPPGGVHPAVSGLNVVNLILSCFKLALRYKQEGREIDSRWCHWNFSLT
jgi:hypothetical protein